ncbi:MAG: hypothetical protein IKG22_12855, partial [Atopobiaceae bacterium]|nr:hypothetical protein [Atopobiaceae bacterium]
VAFCVHAIQCTHFSPLTRKNGRLNVAFCVHARQCPHFSPLRAPNGPVSVAICVQPHFATVTSENDRVNVDFCVHRPSARPRHIQKLAAPPPETGSSTCGLVTLSITLQLFARVPPATRKTN